MSTTTTYTLNGAELSEDSFKAFYSAVIGIKADNSIKDPSTVSAQSPYITIVFNRNTQYFPTYTVTYTPYDSSFYQATVEGKTKLLINKLDINSLVEKIQALQTVSE